MKLRVLGGHAAGSAAIAMPVGRSPTFWMCGKQIARRQITLCCSTNGLPLPTWNQPVEESPIEVQVEIWRIGDVGIVSMRGEPFAEIGVAVRKASPFAHTMFCGYSDGVGGDYLPTSCEYDQGGYEVERTPYGKNSEQRLVAETIELFNALQE